MGESGIEKQLDERTLSEYAFLSLLTGSDLLEFFARFCVLFLMR